MVLGVFLFVLGFFLCTHTHTPLEKIINNRRIVKTVMQNAAGCSANTAMHLDLQCYLSGLEM